MTVNDPAVPEWPASLRTKITEQFSREEIKDFCFDLGIDFDELGVGGKSSQTIDLIRLMADDGRVVELIELCAELRPDEDWGELKKKATEQPDLFKLPADQEKSSNQFVGDFRGATITIVGSAEAQNIEHLKPEPGESPYKGLQYFDEDDADDFFGRELLTAKIVNRLNENRFLTVIGASGSGKSSLIRAGVVPALKTGQPLADGSLPPSNSSHWTRVVLTPSAHPLDALAASLTSDSGSVSAVLDLRKSLAESDQTLGLAARQLMAQQGSPHLLIVIDQFEEIFTLCRQPEEREAFVNNIVAAADPAGGQNITILATLRADFYAQCAQYDHLRTLVSNQQEYIGAMTRDELTRAITQPAANGDWEVQEGLVDQMLDDVGAEPGALPLLSHALLETWQRRRGRTMTLSSYKESGGVRGAIAQTAESIFKQRLNPEQQAVARMVFMRLTELGESDTGDTPDTRRQAVFSELITRSTDTELLDAVLKILTDARLITASLLPPSETKVIEVAHEALIREWPTLRGWLDQDRTNLIHHRQLTADVNDWQKLDRDPSMLYRGLRLEKMEGWIQSFPEPLSLEEQAFLDASRAIDVEEAKKAEKLESAGRNQRLLIGVAAVLLLAVIGVTAYFWTRPEPVIPEEIPLAETMSGDFNVLVAEIAVLNDAGQLVNDGTDAGEKIAQGIQAQLAAVFEGEDGFEVWADGVGSHVDIGVVADNLAGVPAPETRADELKGNVLIYGTLRPKGDLGELLIEFYMAPQYDLNVNSLIGIYAFEMPIPVFDIENPGAEIDEALAPQVEAVARLARGLNVARLGRLEAAVPDFAQASQLVPDASFTHFFEGEVNLLLGQTDSEKAADYLAAAETAFGRAPDNAKARIGLGSVYFVRGQAIMVAVADTIELNGEADVATELDEAEMLVQLALEQYDFVIAEGPQVETYGVPVDSIALVGKSMTTRLQTEIAYYRGDSPLALTHINEAILFAEQALGELNSAVTQKDYRLLAQTHQAVGTFYEWQRFLISLQGNSAETTVEVEHAKQNAIDAYRACIQQGDLFPFDQYMIDEVVEKLCRPSFEALSS